MAIINLPTPPGGYGAGVKPNRPKAPQFPGRINLPMPAGGYGPGVHPDPPVTINPGGVNRPGGPPRIPAGDLHSDPGGGGLPGAAGGTAAPKPLGPPPPDPRDAMYYQNVSDNQFKTNNQLNSLSLQEANANTALQNTLGQLAYQQPRSELALEQKANAAGSLYSSGYGQNLGNLVTQLAGQRDAAQSTNAGTLGKLTAQIAALQQGIPIYNAGQYLAAAERAAAAAAKNPATGQPPAVPVPSVAAAAGAGKGGVENVTHTMTPVENATHRMVPVRGKGGKGGGAKRYTVNSQGY